MWLQLDCFAGVEYKISKSEALSKIWREKDLTSTENAKIVGRLARRKSAIKISKVLGRG